MPRPVPSSAPAGAPASARGWAPVGPQVVGGEQEGPWSLIKPHVFLSTDREEWGWLGSGASAEGFFSSIFSPALGLILHLGKMVSTSMLCCACCCYDNECILKTELRGGTLQISQHLMRPNRPAVTAVIGILTTGLGGGIALLNCPGADDGHPCPTH